MILKISVKETLRVYVNFSGYNLGIIIMFYYLLFQRNDVDYAYFYF